MFKKINHEIILLYASLSVFRGSIADQEERDEAHSEIKSMQADSDVDPDPRIRFLK